MANRSLGTILKDLEESYRKDLKYIESIPDITTKEGAIKSINEIVAIYGKDFVLDTLKYDISPPSRTESIRAMYDDLCTEFPRLKKAEIREKLSVYFNLTDKAIQKHIYKKSRKK